jgi:2,4-dienoyl-CoA reductase-like NADH-dependent reductase (Old Yellow Enzyme family)
MNKDASASLGVLFEPFSLNKLELRNRIAMAPMTRQSSPDRIPGKDVAAYYRARAEGGAGLIITEGTTLADPASSSASNVPRMHGESSLAGWKSVVDGVHASGGHIFSQLWHVGMVREADDTPESDLPNRSPSGLSLAGEKTSRPMTQEEIADILSDYAQAAAAAITLGFDGIELHGAHGYLA